MTGDLHCHTTFSDGSVKPSEIPELAKRFGVRYAAITDHDCMAGADAAAETPYVKIIKGLEVSTFDRRRGRKVHILCYCPKKTAGIAQLCAQTLKERQRTSAEIIGILSSIYPIDYGYVEKYKNDSPVIFKQHIILALMHMGYAISVFGELYENLFSKGRGCAYVEPQYPETIDAMRVIKDSGGICVLAHPGLYKNFEILPELAAEGLDGIEVWHPRQSEADTIRAGQAADELRLIKTGGSDFHGAYSSRPVPYASKTTPGPELEKFLKLAGIETAK